MKLRHPSGSSGPVLANPRNGWEYRRPLTPGERIIDGRVYYSAAWLGRAPVIEAGPVMKHQRWDSIRRVRRCALCGRSGVHDFGHVE